MADGIVSQKRCTACKLVKDASEFSLNRGATDGLFTWCKACMKIKRRPRRKDPKDRKKPGRKVEPNEVRRVGGKVEILLNRGRVAVVDEEDYPKVVGYRWTATAGGYVTTQARRADYSRITLMLHRVVMGLVESDELWVDHRDHDPLNNVRSNLRLATISQNSRNRKGRCDGSSRFKGVSKQGDRWRAVIYVGGKNLRLGVFCTEEEAAVAYNHAAKEHYGEFAYLNEFGDVAPGRENRRIG